MTIFKVITIYISILNFSKCYNANISKNSIPSLTNFRNNVEGVIVENSLTREDRDTDPVAFLVKNAKQIFSDTNEPTILLEPDLNKESNDTSEIATISLKPILTLLATTEYDIEDHDNEKNNEHNKIYPTNITLSKSSHSGNIVSISEVFSYESTTVNSVNELLETSKKYKFLQKSQYEKRDFRAIDSKNVSLLKTAQKEKNNTVRRSCIFCDNIASVECNNPNNKLITSSVCEHDDDVCYSLHTPFGIVDRGCFNVNRNLTTYVCSCNLCNYISISEMPRIFSTKRDWIENVIELTRTKSFRKSIFKDMSCLRCEVNATKAKDLIDNANCLEGNIGTLTIQECAENEICGVKAIRSEGYIWRGCLTRPLYNFWWMLCDRDLCNYDSLVSIYDEVL